MLDFLTPEYYQRIARTLEDGKIQMAFFDDRLALPDLIPASRWAEVIFTSYPNAEAGARSYRRLRQAVADAGRDPDTVTIAPAVQVITAETPELVAEKHRLLGGLARSEDGVALLCEALDTDFSAGRSTSPSPTANWR